MKSPADKVWTIKDQITGQMLNDANRRINNANGPVDLSLLFHLKQNPEISSRSNIIVLQHMLTTPFELKYSFHSKQKDFLDGTSNFDLKNRLKVESEIFDRNFEQIFQLNKKNYSLDMKEFGQYLLSNMLGGMGYFYGTSIVDDALKGLDEDSFSEFDNNQRPGPNPHEVGPFKLFTGVPSRPFFPRGFLWDSGFDLLLIEAFDLDIRCS